MFQKTTLKSGLRTLIIPTEGTKTVTVLVLVKTGSRYETENIGGISHFLEHMFFKGTKKRPNTKQISEELDRIGGEFNAFTHKEYTGYYAKVASPHLDLAMDVISDIFFNSKLEEKEIEREKGVIVEEINMYLDTPMRYVGDLFEHLMFGNSPMGRDIAGEKEIIKNLTRTNFVNYLHSNYLTNNTLVCVGGNINVKTTVAKINRYFKKSRKGSRAKPLPAKIKNDKQEVLLKHKNTDQTHLCLGVEGYDLFHPKRFAFMLFGSILGGYMSSRLWLTVREKLGLAYYVRANTQMYIDTGYLVIQAGLDNKRVKKAIKAIMGELKKIKQKKISQRELNKAKENIKGGLMIELESSDALANFFGLQEILTENALTLEEIFASIDKVTTNDILAISRDILKDNKLKLAMIGPFKDGEEFRKILHL